MIETISSNWYTFGYFFTMAYMAHICLEIFRKIKKNKDYKKTNPYVFFPLFLGSSYLVVAIVPLIWPIVLLQTFWSFGTLNPKTVIGNR